MNNKGVGSIFCLISAILISAKYIAAACFMSNITTKDTSWFAEGLSYVGPFLSILSLLALIIGLSFLSYDIYQNIKKNKK